MRAILTYHSIDPSGSPISVDAVGFRRHVEWIASGAVRVVGLGELLALPEGTNALAITFDDGFANFAEAAWPLLREHGLPATLFVVSERVGTTNAWGGQGEPGIPTLPLLDWDALARLAEEGLTLGAHSRTHPHLETLDDAALADEVEGCARTLVERTGRRPEAFCYPFGTFDERTLESARAHYAHACTTELDVLGPRPDPHRLPRLDAYYYREGERLGTWGSAGFRAHLALRRGARRVRRMLS